MKLCKSLAILCNVIGLIIIASVLVILIAVGNRMMYFNSIIDTKSRVKGFFSVWWMRLFVRKLCTYREKITSFLGNWVI